MTRASSKRSIQTRILEICPKHLPGPRPTLLSSNAPVSSYRNQEGRFYSRLTLPWLQCPSGQPLLVGLGRIVRSTLRYLRSERRQQPQQHLSVSPASRNLSRALRTSSNSMEAQRRARRRRSRLHRLKQAPSLASTSSAEGLLIPALLPMIVTSTHTGPSALLLSAARRSMPHR